jgi:murein DD-endopeptidase MepM/ murein hydrolase activator NlpD
MKRYWGFCLMFMASLHVVAQQGVTARFDQLPPFAIDTLPVNDRGLRIILYSNRLWGYYNPDAPATLGNLPVYQQNWDTTQVFAYKNIELADLPDLIDIRLISSLEQFHYPAVGRIVSKYGLRGRRDHNGVDIAKRLGEPIHATFEGKVRYAKYNTGGFGNLVIIRHPNGLETWYAHMTKLNVEPNEYVGAGQVIGFAGSTGRSSGVHLHYEVRYCDQTFDPEHIIDFTTGQLKYQTFALEKSYFNIRSRASDELIEDDIDGYLADLDDTSDVQSEDILNIIARAQNGASTSSSSEAVYHTVVSGNTLGAIALRYGVTVDQICRLNNITRTTILRVGRRLRIK